MAVSREYLDYVHDQLSGLGGVSSRRMFGGAGLYCDEFSFALIDNDTLYLRVNDDNRADYTSRGMGQFRPYADRPELSMSYYETPADVLEDTAQLVSWARRSVAVAVLAGKRPARTAPPGGRPRGRPKAPAPR